MGDTCKKAHHKKDRTGAEARTRKHKARRIAADDARKTLHARTRAALVVAKLPVRDVSRWARELRREGCITA